MRLIDADELKEYASFLKSGCIPNSKPYKMYESLERMIDKSPIIDAESVKHGHWDGWICSNCSEEAPALVNGGYYESLYCPNCGAKMDEVQNEVD